MLDDFDANEFADLWPLRPRQVQPFDPGVATAGETWPWLGSIRVVVRDKRGRFAPGGKTFHNLITDAGTNLMRDILGGFVTDGKIRYVAVGTSSTAPATGQTQLVAESFRKAVTQYDNTVGTAQVKTVVYLAPGEANIAIQEIGWFAGTGATASANTGVMIARVLYAHTKTSGESININRVDTL